MKGLWRWLKSLWFGAPWRYRTRGPYLSVQEAMDGSPSCLRGHLDVYSPDGELWYVRALKQDWEAFYLSRETKQHETHHWKDRPRVVRG